MNPNFEAVRKIISQSSNIVFLGGAGVSTASGIPDFRSASGLYNRQNNTEYSPEDLLSHAFLMRLPREFYAYLRGNLYYPGAKPNQAHLALSQLESYGKLKNIITQNIDGLHQLAGSRNVIELHGNLNHFYCMKCGRPSTLSKVIESTKVPYCEKCGGLIRPDVVLYGEYLDPDRLSQASRAIADADLLIIGGTSLVVYPAAGLVRFFHGRYLILINREPTDFDSRANYVFHADIAEVLPQLI